MEHDPMCPAARLPKPYSGETVVIQWHERECLCDLIARVREDERDEAQRLLIKHGARQFTTGERMGRAFGREAALRDAVEAVKNVAGEYDGSEWEQGRMALRVAIAAIEALATAQTAGAELHESPFVYPGERLIATVVRMDYGFGYTVYDPEGLEASTGAGGFRGVLDMLVEGLEAYYEPSDNSDSPLSAENPDTRNIGHDSTDIGTDVTYDGQWERDLYGGEHAG